MRGVLRSRVRLTPLEGLALRAGPGAPESAGHHDLAASGLSADYEGQIALRGIDFAVESGTCVALLGANGAGKSTLLNTLSGVHRPVRGTISFAGQRIERLPSHRLTELGVCHIPEGRGVFPDLTVAENLALSVPAERRERVLERFPRLKERLGQPSGTLSGGEQQMLAMASAIGNDFRLLLLDELSLGLAPLVVDELFDVVGALKGAGASIVVVEQFADKALQLADTVYVLRKGRMVHRGPAGGLRDRPDELRDLYFGTGG